jgi:hypothetical protein
MKLHGYMFRLEFWSSVSQTVSGEFNLNMLIGSHVPLKAQPEDGSIGTKRNM